MRIGPTARDCIVWMIIMFVNIFLFGFRNGEWSPNWVYAIATVVFGIILVIRLVYDRKKQNGR